MKVYIGIDDTDNLDSRGTGYQARALGLSLMEAGLLVLKSVTRHQLLVDSRIPYTSHNSSACLYGECSVDLQQLIGHCSNFLIRESAFDSDAGLCVAPDDEITPELIAYGIRAKHDVLTMADAFGMVKGKNIFLEGFKNARIGVIGSLAAVGLRAGGEDGRLLWTRNLRETIGTFTVKELQDMIDVDQVTDQYFKKIDPLAEIQITEWCRPVMAGGMVTLIAEKNNVNKPYEYQSASKEYIKRISE